MDAAGEADYKPPPDFIEDTKDPLIELSMTGSKELWLIQWPVNQVRFSFNFFMVLLLLLLLFFPGKVDTKNAT